MIRGLIAALRFLTRVPIPGPETRIQDLRQGMAWFPLVGGLVGAATAGVFVLGRHLWPVTLAAAVAVAVGLMITGGFHEDGASDAADGLGGGWTRERTLEIMKDSRIGAYGAMALWVVLMVRWSALCALDRQALWALPLAMVWGRWSICALTQLLTPVSQGLGKEVGGGLGWGSFLGATVWLAAAQLLFHRYPGLIRAALAALATLLAWAFYLKRRMGGQSGDLLGAGNQLVEAAVLLALVAG
jgi:adenosylcobinamide-GDP ribazoletransferase